MKKFLDLITEHLQDAFEASGYPKEGITASLSNRPDLCEYQCNGAMVLAKKVAHVLLDNPAFEMEEAVKPGFINLKVTGRFLTEYIGNMVREEKFGLDNEEPKQMILVDYGGANVAKPLHIGHLRAAVIGESIKRICRYMGHDVLGDVH